MNSVLGFGGCKFYYPNSTSPTYSVEFSGASGIITFKSILEKKINDNHSIVTRLHGWNAEIDTKYLYNLGTSYSNYQDLINILNSMQSSSTQNTVTIAPRYNGSYSNLEYACILESDVKIEDIARVEAGQVLHLKWLVVDKVLNLPSMIQTDASDYWDGIVDNKYVDDGTNQYQDL